MPLSVSEIKNVVIQLITQNGKTNIFEIINELRDLGHYAKQDYISNVLDLMKVDKTIMHLNPDDFIFTAVSGGGSTDLENITTNVQPATGLELDIGSSTRVWQSVHSELYYMYDPDDHGDQGGFRYEDGEYEVFYNGQWVSIFGGTTVNNTTVLVSSGKNFYTTNSYLNGAGGNSMSVVPFIIPYDGYLLYLSAATDGYFTWDAEVHVNGSLVPGASLSLSGVDKAYSPYSGINFAAGDKVQLYCKGTNIWRPRIDAVFAKS